MGKLWKKCTLGIYEARYRSREAEVLEDSVLSWAGKAIFEPVFSSPFSEAGRMAGDDSNMWTWLVAMTSPILLAFLHINFGLCVCFRQCDRAIRPPSLGLLLLRKVVLTLFLKSAWSGTAFKWKKKNRQKPNWWLIAVLLVSWCFGFCFSFVFLFPGE